MGDNQDWITVRGARTHNLKNIDVKLPRGKFVVVSVFQAPEIQLAFDTLYAKDNDDMLRVYPHMLDNLSGR